MRPSKTGRASPRPDVSSSFARLRRREFILKSSRAALGFCCVPLAAQAQGYLTTAHLKYVASWKARIADLEKLIPKLMEETMVPGLSIAIVRNAKLSWRRGFGVMDNGSKAPVANDTVFEVASMSKPVFAYAVMKLCEQGVMDLDTPLTHYTSERFLEGDPRLDLITARHVLSHTSGFQNWRSKNEPLKIHFTPGERHLYSGEGYNYLQSVVTHLTGRSSQKDCATYEAGLRVCATDIDSYLKTNLLVPLGMGASGYVWTDRYVQLAARPHDMNGRPLSKTKPTATDAARYAAAGGLHTTPTDYAKFMVEIIAPRKPDVWRLRKASLDEMVRPQTKVEDHDDYSILWALGWRIAHTKDGDLINHGGDNQGFHSFAEASIKRKSAFVILTNGDNGADLIKKLAPAVARWLTHSDR